MNLLKLPLICLLLVSIIATPIAGQQKRRTTKKPPANSPAAPAPAPVTPVTFDTLIAADSFKVYGEVRSVGQLVSSNAANDVLEPILRLGGPDTEFRNLVGWLRSHADELMTSRMLVATWPTLKEVPDIVVAIEFSSPEEATKVESQLNSLLSSVLPPVPQTRVEDEPPISIKADREKAEKEQKATAQANEPPKPPPAPTPAYHLQRADSLLLITPRPFELKKLRPKGSKLLSEDANFRIAYNRFSSEPIFVYIDFDAITKEQEERVKEMEEQRKKAEEEQKALEEKLKAEPPPPAEEGGEEAPGEEGEEMPEPTPSPGTPTELAVAEPEPPSESQMLANAFSGLRMNLFQNIPDLPSGVGIGFAPENESFELRVLLVNSPGETSDPIPIFGNIRFGEPIVPEASRVLPASTELMVMMSIDYPEIHSRMSLMDARESFLSVDSGEQPSGELRATMGTPNEVFTPLRTIEKLLKINIKDELLPVLGSEFAIGLPATGFVPFGPPNLSPQPQPKKESEEAAVPKSPIVAISIRDREAVRQLLPKVLAGFGGKAAASLAQTERREDTELVSIANLFAYAFVGNFLVLSTDAAATRYVVDSYLKGETLSANPHFKNSTRWQPLQVQGQVYISPAVAESYKTWANSSSTHLTDEARNFITRLSANPQPITYSLSNDGLGWLHEVRVPKSVVALAVAGMASAENPPEAAKNERGALFALWRIAGAERQYKEKTGTTYGSIEQLVETELLSKDSAEAAGYKINLRLTAEGFEVTAVPTEYGKTGKLSFFLDQSGVARGADRGGAAASASDQPVSY
ncbi:MAG TPA: DUF3352 domain-containing protein [Pyrinomonadaceae bacterium]|jgi:hypothetical protein|nr:DUF3352 domain-containing protein [Pyrinomonadaceae bacterium]